MRPKRYQTNVVEKTKTHFMFNNPPPESRAVYGIMWKYIVEPGRPQMTIWRMRIACWIPKATDTHSEYVVLIAFPLQQSLQERASMLRVRILSFFFNMVYTIIQVLMSGQLINLRNKLYILWTVHRDTPTWVRPTRCMLFLTIHFT
jgi:hypothetical protein